MSDEKASEELEEAQIPTEEAEFVAGRMFILNSAAGFIARHEMEMDLTTLVYVADFLSGDSIRDKQHAEGVTSSRIVMLSSEEEESEDEGED
jgi:hypothetical protein